MFLRRLEILGFKSFATKTELNFPLGVAAIVGPNGCGKSNVLDAIRWALGEQSAKALRGAEMADVIFSGTDARQAVGMAEVTLTFTDCEEQLGTAFHEVSISRRVYRDGKGEYLLNRNICRLRDIQDLFMDTGIGRSAYSIMEQGKIDLILSSRPEDRRAVFEEAAGITKYKSQRREASRKLEQTEANLSRLTDVLGEVKRQLNSLQRQAAKARRHRTITTDLRLLDTHLAHEQFTKLSAELSSTEAELARTRDEQSAAESAVTSGEELLTQARVVLEATAAQFQEARTGAADCRDRLRAAESRREFNEERAHESQALRERYEIELGNAEQRLRTQEEELTAAAAEESQIAALLQEGRDRLTQQESLVREARARRAQAEAQSQDAQRAGLEGERQLAQLRGELASLTQQQQASDVRKEFLAAEVARAEPTRAEAEIRVEQTKSEIVSGQSVLDARRLEVQSGDALAATAQTELVAAEQSLAEATKLQTERAARLEVLRGLNDAGAGFSAGTQAVLRGLDRPELFKPAIIGVLGASVNVEPRFIAAVEAILGAHLQTILLRDDEVASELLDTLATGKAVGRATLLPLATQAQGTDTATDPIMGDLPEGALAWARLAVKTSAAVARLADRLLAECVIVETLADARALRARHHEFTIATVSGELLECDGALHGGRLPADDSRKDGVLQRQAQIRSLAREVSTGQTALEKLTHERVAAAGRLQIAQTAVTEARTALQTIQIQVSTQQSQLAFLERDVKDLATRTQNLAREQDDAERRSLASRDGMSALEQRVGAATAALEGHANRRTAASESTETARAQENELAETLNEVRLQVVTEQGRHESLRRQRQPMDARREELAELIDHRRRELEEHGRRLERYASESSDLAAEITTAETDLAASEGVIDKRRDEHAAAVGAVETSENQLRAQRQAMAGWHERRSGHEVRAAQLRLRQENLQGHVTERFQLDLHLFAPEPDAFLELYRRTTDQPEAEAADWSRVEDIVRGLREKLDSLGAVNSDAIEEYEALEERNNFLETQNADLIAARKELLGIIAKINTTSRELFAETFERVRTNFQEMFTELFGGGRANLLLVNEEDPLECGIDIIARPPGKQLQSITLLSGGEKTMTAVALLFAVYMVKPSPFCVLDEMDAPLDESNIARFLKILDRFVHQSQFVVITHNKRTIARADVLYGVTMEEAGVSKLVAVRMARREREASVGTDVLGTKNASAEPGAIDEAAEAIGQHGEGPSVAESFGKTEKLHSEAEVSA